jgi:transposase-like protein
VDPHHSFCPNPDCPARGQAGRGNVRVHSHKDRRYRCATCNKTFAASTGTPFYRLHKDAALMVAVLTLLCHGCPVQAIVAAFGLDERTVADWQHKAGRHGRQVHEALVEQGQLDCRHVQADELCAKVAGQKTWVAMAMAVPTRLWLGGAVSAVRDLGLINRLVRRVRACCLVASPLLVCVDGLASYVTAFLRAFRAPLRTGRVGRPRLVVEPLLLLAQVVKSYAGRCLSGVARRGVRGTEAAVAAVLAATRTGTQINTSYIERLNATFRAHLATLVRKGRALAQRDGTLEAGMWLVGGAYNFCWPHDSLRLEDPAGPRKWLRRTPAMAAGLTDHPWSMRELLDFKVAPNLHG